ncbi:MAG: hypothetical protein SFU27_04305 [Thermonemataceae bacterium]|nr:hypothetical protein [Thermonemataceae bacterium]
MQKVILLSVLLVFTNLNFSTFNKEVEIGKTRQNEDLELIIEQIKNRASLKNALLDSENMLRIPTPNGGEKVIWQGSFSYCGGQCASSVTVTANFIFGIQFNTQISEDYVPSNCPCGSLLNN